MSINNFALCIEKHVNMPATMSNPVYFMLVVTTYIIQS